MTVWRKSSYSGGDDATTCVEVAALTLGPVGQVIGVRDSTDPAGPKLHLNRHSFAVLVRSLKMSGAE
ncbi:DUF397 domain-containing protein [Spirillospora sp. NPDC047279]|uniref:DUF397 domain-containing protein n=1 Tax=Spirillospora sp. NPDC047279 TaxID=3155478 RepID=UPI003404FA44